MVKAKSKSHSRSARPVPADVQSRTARLLEVARLAQIFIDGEAIGRLLTPQGNLAISTDDIDYHHAPFIELKKLLLRIEQTPADGKPVYVNVWRQRPDDPTKGEVVIAGLRLSPFGFKIVPMPKALRAALLNQRTGSEHHADGEISIFAPLYDSLHHVAGAVEVFDSVS